MMFTSDVMYYEYLKYNSSASGMLFLTSKNFSVKSLQLLQLLIVGRQDLNDL